MKTLVLSLFAFSIIAFATGCSTDSASPMSNDIAPSPKSGNVSAQLDYLIKIPPIEGETEALEEAMEIYSGQGAQAIGLLLPAVQKVREAMNTSMEEADRDGNVDADVVLKEFRSALHSFRSTGDELSINDICLVSLEAADDETHKQWIDVLSYGRNGAANVEYVLFHFFNGLGILFEEAGMQSDDAAGAIQSSMGFIEELSEVNIQSR